MLNSIKSLNTGEIFAGLCLSSGLITLIYQSRKTKSIQNSKKIKENLDDYSFRELFHLFINPEYHYDKMEIAKEFSDRMHLEASEYMLTDHDDNDDFPDHFTYFEYSKENFNKRLDYIFDRLFKEKYLDWCDQGEPVGETSRYWWAQSRVHLLTYLIQREPYHLTDGIWLRGVHQGPMSSIQSKLFSIYVDELGNGDQHQNHPNVYLNLLTSLGLSVPSITSREFIEQQSILDISFKKPLLTLTTSLFPMTYEPEILGYTLWLETTSASEHAPLRRIFDRYNFSSDFSLLHTTIDNNLNGHGKYARDAVIEYLDQIENTQGKQAMEQHWKRIWIGYVAYGTTGDINQSLKILFQNQSPQEQFCHLIQKKSSMAKKMHGQRRIGQNNLLLADLFRNEDPIKLCNELANSKWIVKGHPEESLFLTHAISFGGPMYQVFNADELIIISTWILSLSPSTTNQFISLILKKRSLSHLIPFDIKLKLPNQQEKLLRDLFMGNPNDLLAAFRTSKWTFPSDGSKLTEENVETCQLMKSIQSNGIFEQIFNYENEEKDFIRNWLLDGSPLIDETFQHTNNHIQINSHRAFQFQF